MRFQLPDRSLHVNWLYAIIALLVGIGSPLIATAQTKFNLAEARKSVVLVKRITPGVGPASGSGFFVSADGLIYTNRHVALATDDSIKGSIILVGVPSAKDVDVLEYYRAEIVFVADKKSALDFAVLKIAGKKGAPDFKPLPLSYDKVELGADVAALGYPLVQENQPNLTFTKGSISATRVAIDERAYYQTDAAVNPGNSGGPLVNLKGEAIGIVTLKKGNADNIGFALYLNEIKQSAEQAQKTAVAIKPEAGPLDPKNLPVAASIAPKKNNWDVIAGNAVEAKGALVLDNNGGTYAIATKEALPENFQLVIKCRIEFLQGAQRLQPSQRTILRTMCVRFGTKDTKSMILERKGNLVQFSHALLLFYKEGEKDAVKVEQRGNPEGPFVLVITKQGGDYSIAVDGEVLLKYHDAKPLKATEKCLIGGYLSRLHISDVTINKLDEGKK